MHPLKLVIAGNHDFTLDIPMFKHKVADAELVKKEYGHYGEPIDCIKEGWGFQYNPNTGHGFGIGNGVNLVITHGPPGGVMDYTVSHQRIAAASLAVGKYHIQGIPNI
ncbi:hypothetical protein AJ78_04949 [Emergomyces pasteurianus Ep9510]|uniref:Calcineurin-like phosphoesterase domain-containing protein n=1 Tax=Emergomyces pasteurianus Ep9510 TaxID=1447872 RepID=A0A1J9QFK8_9EURO|nr:hypothetical protein AJ78_04949 [Emergomyces pasteurianus Ep9510]